MTEASKTIVYVVVATVIGVVAYATQPGKTKSDTGPRPSIFDRELNDVSQIARLEIIKPSALGVDSFEVAKDKQTGAWTIPSEEGYPADAEDQMKEVSTLLIGLEISGTASDVQDDHELYGVVDPSGQDVDATSKGLGILVRVSNADGVLADLIIGKESETGKSYRFVRRPKEDRTYVVKINTEKLSTKFEDWIEQDLLKLNALDVENMSLMDYAINRVQRGAALEMRAQMDVKWDSAGGKWELTELKGFKSDGKPFVIVPSITEELDQTKLDDMKRALDDLKIAGVHKKPPFLTADLKVSAKVSSDDANAELQGRGFYVGQKGDILGANGEVHVVLKDGVEYVMHFGGTSGLQVSEDKKKDGIAEAKLNRFLMVRCKLNMSKFPLPVKETLKPPKSTKSDQPPAPAGKKKKAGKKKGKTDIELEAEKNRIENEFQKKLDDRKDKIEKAKKRVVELNSRFAKWYYIVADDVYKKIHLSRENLIKDRANAKDEGFGIDAFRGLEKGGVKGKPGGTSDGSPPLGAPAFGPGGPGGPGFGAGPGGR